MQCFATGVADQVHVRADGPHGTKGRVDILDEAVLVREQDAEAHGRQQGGHAILFALRQLQQLHLALFRSAQLVQGEHQRILGLPAWGDVMADGHETGGLSPGRDILQEDFHRDISTVAGAVPGFETQAVQFSALQGRNEPPEVRFRIIRLDIVGMQAEQLLTGVTRLIQCALVHINETQAVCVKKEHRIEGEIQRGPKGVIAHHLEGRNHRSDSGGNQTYVKNSKPPATCHSEE